MNKAERAMLQSTVADLKGIPFPDHPSDLDLSDWILELSELDGHLVGVASTMVGSVRPRVSVTDEAEQHGRRLSSISVVGDDEGIYRQCVAYIDKLIGLERMLRILLRS
jgi:hypothetical protein